MLFSYPATEKVIAVTHTAAAAVFGVSEIFCPAQSGERGYELKGRPRRQCADRPVYEWIALVFLQRLPILGFDARNECVGVERRHRDHSQNVAVVWIDNDCASAADCTQRFFGDRLDPRVQREKHVGSLLRRIFFQHAVNLALGVPAQMANTRFSAQVLVHYFLDIRFPLPARYSSIFFLIFDFPSASPW